MKLFFIRHGIAEERSPNQRDEIRKLTDVGIVKTKQVAEKLNILNLRFDLILTSPLVRAKETAEILLQAQLSPQIIETPLLAPEGILDDWLNWLVNSEYHQEDQAIALVGHEPNLSSWAEILLWGEVSYKLTLKKAGIIGIEMTQINKPKGKGKLFLYSTPKIFQN